MEDKTYSGISISATLGYNMINTSWQMKEALRKAFTANGYDITSDQFAVLLRLWDEEGISQLELCQRTCKNKSNLTRILDSMEKRDLLYRKPSKQDRRSFNVFLTDGGKTIKDKLIPIAVNIQNSLFTGITENESKLLEGILIKINKNLDITNNSTL
ncbi:MAG: MarR family transcriptional regulator [Bacillota bacterium]|nr:MarR family transcriptional regulator [Bacillota bacterium]